MVFRVKPYWADERRLVEDADDGDQYPLPFHPLELAEDALRTLFGFNWRIVLVDPPPLDPAGFRRQRFDRVRLKPAFIAGRGAHWSTIDFATRALPMTPTERQA